MELIIFSNLIHLSLLSLLFLHLLDRQVPSANYFFVQRMSSSQPAVGSIPASTGGGAYVAAPPPAGYPTRDGFDSSHAAPAFPVTTKSKGDGFWKGCCAALCCCCVLDACF